MAYWNGKEIVRRESEPAPDAPGWLYVDCGCCDGIQWGGDTPRECNWCKGRGGYAVHERTRRIAEYPGGPFLGSLPKTPEGDSDG